MLPRFHRRSLLAVALGLAATAPLVAQGSVDWPWGAYANGADAGSAFNRLDLYNLGLLGAKACDADKPDPQPRTAGGKRRFARNKAVEGDAGPKRLKILALLGGAPAQKAKLAIGDILVGVDQDDFAEGCFAPLARALQRAESDTGSLELVVERGGKPLRLKAKIKKSKAAADPVRGKHRDKILNATLKWLADRQSGDGGYPQTLGGMNGRIANTCLAGLAWIAGGSNQRGGKYRKNIQKAVAFVQRGLYAKDPFAGRRGGNGNWNQTNWAYAHAVIFLGELQVASKNKKLQPFLQKITDELCRRQEVSGGYGHGPGGANALGYVELNILAGYVLSGLGLAKQAGCKIDDKVVTKLNAYLKASASAEGGVGYSSKDGQRGQGNIGRTAAAWLGAVGLGLRADAWTKKMGAYVKENVVEVLKGHASLMQHVMLAGIAAKALGEESTNAYWKQMLRDFTLARCPDGSFQPRPWHETVLMGSNTDVSMGDVWTTASWAIVLAADKAKGKKGGLQGWCGMRVK